MQRRHPQAMMAAAPRPWRSRPPPPRHQRRPATYQKKLGPYRDLGVDVEHADAEMTDWAHAHETDVNVAQCEVDSHRTVTDLKLEVGNLGDQVRERTVVYAALKDELDQLNDRKSHMDNIKEQWSKFKSSKTARSSAFCVLKREYSDRNNQTPVGGGGEGDASKFWSVRIVDPGSRADPTSAERVAQLEDGEENTLYDVAKIEVESKGYDLMVKRENGNLEAANDKLLEMQRWHREAEQNLGQSKSNCIDAKRAAEDSQQACVKFVVAQRERRLLRKNTIRSKKAELSRATEETRKMEAADKKREDDIVKNETELKEGAIAMQVGVSINRVAIEGYDARMGTRQEFENFDRLRRVTKGGFPADVVDAYLTEHDKRRRAKQAGSVRFVHVSLVQSHLLAARRNTRSTVVHTWFVTYACTWFFLAVRHWW